MNKLFKVGVIEESEVFKALEGRLGATLVPVKPRNDYVHELRRNLLKENELEFSEPKPAMVQKALLTAAGLLSGTLLLVLGVRGIIALLKPRGVIQQLRNSIQEKKAAPLNPVA